ncbi:YqaJ viral recombinase family protein [Paracidovorax citrulli]|uniref:lambda-exonuclease family protein n=1 Tax=Paracidovorax citrulli TaxID=80869 RepID=UPI003A8076C7
MNVQQGSPAWHAHRRNHFNASDAPAMMGCSPYKTRDELIAELATGIVPDVDAATQAVFDAGHRFEELARPLAEQIIGEELAPLVGSEGKLSASFDGLTLMEDTGFEHKSLNKALREAMFDGCTGSDLPMQYRVQMEQQCMVSGAQRILFMASKWDGDTLVEERHCWYEPDHTLRAEIVAGWAQLEKEVAAYKPAPAAPAPVVGRTPENLPALLIQVSGAVTASNLGEFKEHALAVLGGINRDLKTDQDFATAESTVKWCADVESRLAAAKDHALSQTASIEEVFRAIDDISAEARRVRLDLDKLVKARKEEIRTEIATSGAAALREHIASLNARLGKPYMPAVPSDFAGAIKGKRTVDSLRSAVNDELARAKIAANEIADRIQINLTTLREHATQHAFLFADTAQIVLKHPEDLAMLVKSRISDHDAKEAARIEAERERIRREEADRADREARARLEQEERDRQAEIAQARKDEALPAPLLDDLAGAATHARDTGLAELGARQAIAAARGASSAPAAPAAAAQEVADLRIGTINERLGFTVTADFLLQLGFEPAPGKGPHRFYRASQFPAIARAISTHVLLAADAHHDAAAY